MFKILGPLIESKHREFIHQFDIKIFILEVGYFGLHRYLIRSHFALQDWILEC